VVKDSFSLATLVSPQIPMIAESSAVQAIMRFNESGVTLCGMTASLDVKTRIYQCSSCITHGVSVNLEDVLVKRWVDTDDIPHLMVDFQLEWVHGGVKVNSVEIVQQQDLRITLSSVSRLASLGRLADLDDDHVSEARHQVQPPSFPTRSPFRKGLRDDMTLKLVQSRVDLSVIELSRPFANRFEQQRLRIEFGIDPENVENDTRRRPVVTATDNVAVADDEDQLSLVVIVEGSERIDGSS